MRKIRETAYDVGLCGAGGEMRTSIQILSSEVDVQLSMEDGAEIDLNIVAPLAEVENEVENDVMQHSDLFIKDHLLSKTMEE
ncbi:hypothetical protein L3X38_025586 [Prunus dulcis]|uniref:Uncharacterized protein n=1 Tax=Prunus dulcis TaxID=3755 RepID=A0AAD4Z852_PRUDU|nr:hypothetical protein L3X38_025586 [Prunus dulcis]